MGVPLLRLCHGRKWKVNHILMVTLMCSALCVALSTVSQNEHAFLIFISAGAVLPHACIPVLVTIYSLYPKAIRGKKTVTSLLALNIGALLFSWMGRNIIAEGIEHYAVILMLFSLMLVFASLCSLKLPAQDLNTETLKLGDMFRVFRNDRFFAYMCLTQFILGASHLWLLPFRTNYLVEPGYGFEYSEGTVIVLLVIIPEATKLLSAPFFASLFDRMNFIALRMMINTLFIGYIFLFFMGKNLHHQVLGVFMMGLAMSGGSLSWQLWVTRLAPSDKSAVYMGIHTFLTGIRRVFCPLLGLWALEKYGGWNSGMISATGVALSILLLVPVLKKGRSRFVH